MWVGVLLLKIRLTKKVMNPMLRVITIFMKFFPTLPQAKILLS